VAIKLKTAEDKEPEIYGNENFGIPKDCTKKQKFSKLKLVFYLITVVAICITGYKYYTGTVDELLPEITYDKTRQPLIYHTSSGITLKTKGGTSYDIGDCVTSDGGDVTTYVKPTSEGKTVFFLSKNSNYTEGFDLYMYSVNNDNATVIDKNVTDFKASANGKLVVYKKGNKLYVSTLHSKRLIANNVGDYYTGSNNQVITYFLTDGTTMYTCGTSQNDSPVLVDTHITKVISPKSDYTDIYYIKDSDLYLKKYGSEKTLLYSNVTDAIIVDDSVYFTTEETYERPLDDFFTDDVYETDEELTYPDGADFITETNGLSFFDEEGFAEAIALYEAKLVRDNIREYFKEYPPQSSGYSLYSYKQGEAERVDTNLATPYLSYNSNKNILAYKRYDSKLSEIFLSELTSVEEAAELARQLLGDTPDTDVYLVKEGKKPFFALEESFILQLEISLDSKYLYCIESTHGKSTGQLIRYEIGSTSLKNRKVIADTATDFALDGSDSDAVMVFCNNSLSLYYDGKLKHLSNSSCHDFFYVDDTLYFFDEYDQNTKSGTLKSIRKGNVTVVDTNVFSFKVRKYNSVSYIKNYNPDLGTGTLYIKNGNSVKQQDTHVGAIIN